MKGQLKFPVRAKGMRLLDADGMVVMDSISTIDFPVNVSELHAAEVAARLNLNHDVVETLRMTDLYIRDEAWPTKQQLRDAIAAVFAKIYASKKPAGIKPEDC